MRRSLLSISFWTVIGLACIACSQDEEGTLDPADTSSDASTLLPATDSGSAGGGTGGGASPSSDAGASALNDAGARDTSARDAGTSARDAGSNALDASSSRDAATTASDAGSGADASGLPKFSFFVTSLNAMRTLSKSQNGFGGDLRYGETGEGAGLRGADKICAAAAELGMPGASAKQWRAFLSTSSVDAKSRIGEGPWYDRTGRLIAENLTALLKERPEGAEAIIRDDLPNENGAPNRAASAEGSDDDNHDVVTGTNAQGAYDGTSTCEDWTSTNTPSSGERQNGPRVGHSWPAMSGRNWMAAHRAPGCAPSVALRQTGGGSGTGIGNGGGYGGIYCFALAP